MKKYIIKSLKISFGILLITVFASYFNRVILGPVDHQSFVSDVSIGLVYFIPVVFIASLLVSYLLGILIRDNEIRNAQDDKHQ